MIKVLSLLQPWASLAVLGHKKIETRYWNTKYRGVLYIHASLGKNYKKLKADDPLYRFYHPLFAYNKIEPIEKLPFGAIIGKVDLIETYNLDKIELDTIINHNEDIYGCEDVKDIKTFHNAVKKEEAFGNYESGRFGWLLANPVIFDKPIPAKGQLGIWNYEL